MVRLIVQLLVILALGFAFAWLADRPGNVIVEWQDNRIETSLMVTVAMVAILCAITLVLWTLIRTIINSPGIISRFFATRRRERGFKALSEGLIAAGAGDALVARKMTRETGKLISEEPLVRLLDAQTALLEGRRDDARKGFEVMLSDPRTRLVAMRGLYLEAERDGKMDAARRFAEQAYEEAPQIPWSANAVFRFRSADGEWAQALATLDANQSAGLVDGDTARRARAVLLTAMGLDSEDREPDMALKHVLEAIRLAPSLVPAVVTAGRIRVRQGDIGRAIKGLETGWKAAQHPEIADQYIHVRTGDSAIDRLKRAERLLSLNRASAEGAFAVAEAAISARNWAKARKALANVLENSPTERGCLLMAEIERSEHGDRGRVRDWLDRAVKAAKDPIWIADGKAYDDWAPISAISGQLDAFEWRVPYEQERPTSPTTELKALLAPLPELEPDTDVVTVQEVETVEPEPVDEVSADADEVSADNDEVDVVASADAAPPVDDGNKPDGAEAVFPLERRPDDPGITDKKGEKQNGFRLF